MAKMNQKEKDLELRARELDRENKELRGDLELANIDNSALRKQVRGYQAQILEYQYRAGEKQRPNSEITLEDYLDGLNQRKPGYNNELKVIKEARISQPVSKRDWLGGFHYLQFNIMGGREEASFIHWCPKKQAPDIKAVIDSVADTNYKVIVIAHNKNYFIEGIIKEDGEKVLFDRL